MHTSPLWGQTEIPMDTKEKTKREPLPTVKTILRSELNMHIRKEHNIAWDAAGAAWVTHCAGCGAKIIEG